MAKNILLLVLGLVVGVIAGIFIGRYLKEREWSHPNVLRRLTAADVLRSEGSDADAVPAPGTLVLGLLPLARARVALAELTHDDPVVMQVGAVGNGDEGSELHLVVENRGPCPVTALAGIAYGYDAYGRPSRMNKGGEPYVAFTEKKVEDLAPSHTHQVSQTLHHPDLASLALAQVDEVTCEGGATWTRDRGFSTPLEAFKP
jgi:hypothetical protein